MDPKQRFSALASDYARFRPEYPDEVVAACARYAALAPGARVADIGCGTGIAARRFAAHGYRVVGVDPSEPMLAQARASGGGPTYMQGEAARTGLPARSADLLFAAQALHWFDMEACVPEWRRVLAPDGACAAFWNYRRQDGWQMEYEALLGAWSSDYPAIAKATGNGQDNSDWVKASPLCCTRAELEFDNVQPMTLTELLGRANSSSYVVHGVADRGGFEAALRTLFAKHEVDGRVSFRYRTYLLLWRFVAE